MDKLGSQIRHISKIQRWLKDTIKDTRDTPLYQELRDNLQTQCDKLQTTKSQLIALKKGSIK